MSTATASPVPTFHVHGFKAQQALAVQTIDMVRLRLTQPGVVKAFARLFNANTADPTDAEIQQACAALSTTVTIRCVHPDEFVDAYPEQERPSASAWGWTAYKVSKTTIWVHSMFAEDPNTGARNANVDVVEVYRMMLQSTIIHELGHLCISRFRDAYQPTLRIPENPFPQLKISRTAEGGYWIENEVLGGRLAPTLRFGKFDLGRQWLAWVIGRPFVNHLLLPTLPDNIWPMVCGIEVQLAGELTWRQVHEDDLAKFEEPERDNGIVQLEKASVSEPRLGDFRFLMSCVCQEGVPEVPYNVRRRHSSWVSRWMLSMTRTGRVEPGGHNYD